SALSAVRRCRRLGLCHFSAWMFALESSLRCCLFRIWKRGGCSASPNCLQLRGRRVSLCTSVGQDFAAVKILVVSRECVDYKVNIFSIILLIFHWRDCHGYKYHRLHGAAPPQPCSAAAYRPG
ncbi:hypothetical protein GDO81_030015, partial [Engystomops pustulosus]